jgi:hypothetical protein
MRRHEARLKSPSAFEAVATRRKGFRVRYLIEAYCAPSPDGFGKTKELVLHSLRRMEFLNLYAEELTAKDFTDLGIDLRKGMQPAPKDPASASTDHYSLKPRSASTVVHYWTCHALVPPQVLVEATLRSKATGLFQPNAECRRRGL